MSVPSALLAGAAASGRGWAGQCGAARRARSRTPGVCLGTGLSGIVRPSHPEVPQIFALSCYPKQVSRPQTLSYAVPRDACVLAQMGGNLLKKIVFRILLDGKLFAALFCEGITIFFPAACRRVGGRTSTLRARLGNTPDSSEGQLVLRRLQGCATRWAQLP